jgi:hypothetical protein
VQLRITMLVQLAKTPCGECYQTHGAGLISTALDQSIPYWILRLISNAVTEWVSAPTEI